jgi:hypothetical protein
MSPDFKLIRRADAAFNERDIDGTLAPMHPDVRWPNAMEGGVLVVYTLPSGLIAQTDIRSR